MSALPAAAGPRTATHQSGPGPRAGISENMPLSARHRAVFLRQSKNAAGHSLLRVAREIGRSPRVHLSACLEYDNKGLDVGHHRCTLSDIRCPYAPYRLTAMAACHARCYYSRRRGADVNGDDHANCVQTVDPGRSGPCVAREPCNCRRPGADPDRRAAADDRPVDQERHRELHGDADRPRHDQRARRRQRPQGRIPAGRHPEPDRGDQRDRAADHQGRHQDHDSARASRRSRFPVSQTAERHGVFHWETAGAADIITKRGFKYTFQVGPAAYRYSQAAVDFMLEELAKQARQVGRRPARRAAVGKPRLRQIGRRRRARLCPAEGHQAVYDEGYDQFAHRHDADRAEAQGREAGRAARDLVPERRHPVPAQGQGARLQRRRLRRGQRRLFQSRTCAIRSATWSTASSSPTSPPR